MNYAVIDLGSNTIRLSVYKAENGVFETIISQKEVVGLASYTKKRFLEEDGINKACDILKNYKEIALSFVDEKNIHLFATASLRGIHNQQEALEMIHLACGLYPMVLSGEEEARLDFVGASHVVECQDGILIDIGGASTEIVRFQDSQPTELISIPIGCLSLFSKFVGEIIPNENERKKIKKEIRSKFGEYINWNTKEKLPLMVGVGGTVRAAHKLSCDLFLLPRENKELKTEYIKEILDKLNYNENEIFHTVYKRIPERTLTIFPGLMILHEAIKLFNCKSFVVSDYGVREGYLIDHVLKEPPPVVLTSSDIKEKQFSAVPEETLPDVNTPDLLEKEPDNPLQKEDVVCGDEETH